MKSYNHLPLGDKAKRLGLAVASGGLLLTGCAPAGASRSVEGCGPLQNVAWSADQPGTGTTELINLGGCAQPFNPVTGEGEGPAIPRDGTFEATCLEESHPEWLRLTNGAVLNLTVQAEEQLGSIRVCSPPALPNS